MSLMFKYFTFFFKKKRIALRDSLTLQFYLPMISFHQEKKRLKALGHTNTSPVVRPLPYAWAQTYHPSSVVAMALLGLVSMAWQTILCPLYFLQWMGRAKTVVAFAKEMCGDDLSLVSFPAVFWMSRNALLWERCVTSK